VVKGVITNYGSNGDVRFGKVERADKKANYILIMFCQEIDNERDYSWNALESCWRRPVTILTDDTLLGRWSCHIHRICQQSTGLIVW
jgi:hypothetical protein